MQNATNVARSPEGVLRHVARSPKGAPRHPWSTSIAGVVLLSALSGCGGVIKFSDSTAFAIRGPAPVVAEAPKRVEVKADRIEITEKIQFELDKADIKSESHGLLNEIVQVLRDNPQITKVDVNGHTDSDGDDNYNQGLSDRRAKSVVAYLTGHGIDASRLMSKGFGESKPIADNATSAGKEQNRRVEFLIVEQQGSEKGVLSAQGN